MNSDDLGQFPKPASPQAPVEPIKAVSPTPEPAPVAPSSDYAPLYNDPFAKPAEPILAPQETPDKTPSFDDTPVTESVISEIPEIPAFEETPDEIPSVQPAVSPPEVSFTIPEFSNPEKSIVNTEPVQVTPISISESEVSPPVLKPIAPAVAQVAPQMIAATVPSRSSSIAPIIFIGLLLVAGIGLATTVFLFSQSTRLKNQLTDITQTLEKQKTTVTPTPTSTPIEVVTLTPSPTSEASISAFITPTLTATPTPIDSATPLLYAKQALKVAINREPNAQLILIKTENASDPINSITKYFFRQNLKTKKYFYVTILAKGNPAIIDNAIYVTPDNDIPSLNEAISSESFGIDLDQALKLSYTACLSGLCETASLKAQFIKSNTNYIWQLSFTPKDTTKDALIIQINSVTKEILYKSAGF